MRKLAVLSMTYVLLAGAGLSTPSSAQTGHLVWMARLQSGPRQPFFGPVERSATPLHAAQIDAAASGPGRYIWVDGQSGPRASSAFRHRIRVPDDR